MTQLTFNIIAAYSPEENIWYIENQDPDNWQVSVDVYDSEGEAIQAYEKGEVEWMDI